MKNRILTEAAILFARKGYTDLSMREVAEACHVTKPALYYHFQDKQTLFLSVLEAYLDEINVNIIQARQSERSYSEQIRRIIDAMLHMAPERRCLIRLAMQDIKNLTQVQQEQFNKKYEDLFIGEIRDLISEGVKADEFRIIDPGMACWILLGMVFPFLNNKLEIQDESLSETICEVFLKGVESQK